MTDKELRKLSRLELLELLLEQSKENEKLKEELSSAPRSNAELDPALFAGVEELVQRLDEAVNRLNLTASRAPEQAEGKEPAKGPNIAHPPPPVMLPPIYQPNTVGAPAGVY